MKKRLISAAFVLIMIFSLLPGAASAAGGFEGFKAVNTYSSGFYGDVMVSQWYAPYVQAAYEYGLMNGKLGGRFDPDGVLTLGETVKLAACLNSLYYTGRASFTQGDPWYGVYADYALKNGILSAALTNYDRPTSRDEFVSILSKALPSDAFAAINSVDADAIPDVPATAADAASVLEFYRAGILTGSDSAGSFLPDSAIKRSEVAAVLTRIAAPSYRKSLTLHLTLTAEQVYQKCSSAVFYLEITDIKGTKVKTGSGFFISSGGLAVTNYHVINGAAKITATTADGKEHDVKGVCDYNKSLDLALIWVDGSNFSYLETADSDAVKTGQTVYAIGSPLGYKDTLSTGLISSASRTVGDDEYIQTTAAVSPGSSGGALLNESGKVIGVTSAMASGGQSINFARPINLIKSFKTEGMVSLESILPKTVYYTDAYPVPDFGAYAGVTRYNAASDAPQPYFYLESDLTGGGVLDALSGYENVLEENSFEYYGYAIQNGGIILYYTNAAYKTIVAIGETQVNSLPCIEIQIESYTL